MHIAVYLPLLCALAFAATAPRLAVRQLSPRAGLWTLTLGGSLAAAASTWSLALLAGTLLDDTLPHAARQTIHDPVNDPVAIAAALALLAGIARLCRTGQARTRLHRQIRRAYPTSSGPIVMLDDPVPRAFALPGGGGRIVVSHGMLTALTPAERRVLFAHEHAHLAQRHHRHTAITSAAAALNPLLTPIHTATIHLCERCADETAAAQVGDRTLAASSLARAALAAAAGPDPATATTDQPLHYHHTGVTARVLALQHHPTRGRPSLGAALLALASIAVLADIDATGDFLTLTLHIAR
jgi:hypothetical protein